jgi:hypothetical protein
MPLLADSTGQSVRIAKGLPQGMYLPHGQSWCVVSVTRAAPKSARR